MRLWQAATVAQRGEDATLPGGLAAGAVVHLVDPSIAPNSLLLDMTPGGNVLDAALLPGHAWVTPEGTTIRVDRQRQPDPLGDAGRHEDQLEVGLIQVRPAGRNVRVA